MPPSEGYEVGEILRRESSSFIQEIVIGHLLCDATGLDAKKTAGARQIESSLLPGAHFLECDGSVTSERDGAVEYHTAMKKGHRCVDYPGDSLRCDMEWIKPDKESLDCVGPSI